MSSFLINFTIQDASPEENETLKATMNEAGFLSTIASADHLQYLLPTSVYHCAGSVTKSQIFGCAKRIALRFKKRSSIIVTESVASAWVGLELIGRNLPRSVEMSLSSIETVR